MASLPDVILTGAAYQNLNLATSLITGTPLSIQNKGSEPIRIIIAASLPAASSENGQVIEPLKYLYIENETDIVWGKAIKIGNTHVSVQQLV